MKYKLYSTLGEVSNSNRHDVFSGTAGKYIEVNKLLTECSTGDKVVKTSLVLSNNNEEGQKYVAAPYFIEGPKHISRHLTTQFDEEIKKMQNSCPPKFRITQRSQHFSNRIF